jgi:hypothetical protein
LKRYGKDSIEFIIDEGGSEIKKLYGTTFALPGTAEKVRLYDNRTLMVGLFGCQNHCLRERWSLLRPSKAYNNRTTRGDSSTDREESLGTSSIDEEP